LDPVNAQGLPDELSALVDNVNRLLTRLHDALQTERALSANAAHELRTPLTVAQLRLSNVLALDLSDAARAEVSSASTALAQLKRRTEKLLQLSRAESGAALSRDRVCLNKVVDAVLHEFESDDAAYQRLHVFDDGDVMVMGDFDAIAIAVRNLIENSLRYGGGTTVGIHIAEPGQISVRDSGPGVTADQLLELTQRHVRFAQHSAGFGLGLSIVKTIVERHGGQLRFGSPPEGQSQGFDACMWFDSADAGFN
jgi:two-component system OmpR family sensor kinase